MRLLFVRDERTCALTFVATCVVPAEGRFVRVVMFAPAAPPANNIISPKRITP